MSKNFVFHEDGSISIPRVTHTDRAKYVIIQYVNIQDDVVELYPYDKAGHGKAFKSFKAHLKKNHRVGFFFWSGSKSNKLQASQTFPYDKLIAGGTRGA